MGVACRLEARAPVRVDEVQVDSEAELPWRHRRPGRDPDRERSCHHVGNTMAPPGLCALRPAA